MEHPEFNDELTDDEFNEEITNNEFNSEMAETINDSTFSWLEFLKLLASGPFNDIELLETLKNKKHPHIVLMCCIIIFCSIIMGIWKLIESTTGTRRRL